MAAASRITVEVEEAESRYARQELIAWWDQERLSEARVLVVGAGALGNELVKCLALLGVGRITVVDFDHVEHSNLSRGVFMRESDVGKPKAVVVAMRANDLNPEVEVEALTGDLRVELGVGLVAEYDVILGGLDSRIARLRLNALAQKAGVPYIDGAIEGLIGVARVFTPESSCYECTLSDRALAMINQRRSCALLSAEDISNGRTPTTATSASLIAAIQVQEAIKLIQGAPGCDTLVGKGFVFNGTTHDSYVVEYPAKSGCLAHDRYDTSQSISAGTTLAEVLARATEELGDGAYVQFDHEVVTQLSCRECELELHPNVIAARLGAEAVTCAKCGSELEAELANRFAEPLPKAFDALELADLGLPRQDVVSLIAPNAVDRVQMVVSA
ncbi:MAG: ThiF family adenylyltransferase [Thermoleophilaceae bacterium]|nr:ThiF family adenylyltransferase [Thermoleophilaceae bacterium]